MSNIIPLSFAPPVGFFSRALNTLDRFLMSAALVAVRSGEPTYFGL